MEQLCGKCIWERNEELDAARRKQVEKKNWAGGDYVNELIFLQNFSVREQAVNKKQVKCKRSRLKIDIDL